MKHLKRILLPRTAIMLLVMMLTTATTAWAWQGSGTSSNPYKIASYDDLLTLRNSVNGGEKYQNVYFEQTQDITWPSGTTWDRGIGYDYSHCFSGHYNGNGKKISGFRLTTSDTNAGLFGFISGSYQGSEQTSVIAEVHHLTLENPTVTVTASSSTQYAGALVGYTQLCGRADNNTVTGGTVSFTGVSSLQILN